MSRVFRAASPVILGTAFLVGGLSREALAIKEFADEFKAMYVKEGTPLAAAVDEAKCNVCHAGKSKKDRNAYGNALADRLDKKADKGDKAKIQKALEEVAALPSDPAKPDSPTFGALIEQGKLPAASAN